jgi:hypothetical protein
VVLRSTFPPEAIELTESEFDTATSAEARFGIETKRPETRVNTANLDSVFEEKILKVRMSKIIP